MPAKVFQEIVSPAALVLCGGSSRGAVEVGLYQALAELGLPVDLVIGSSIGALNGAFIAAGIPPAELARLWAESGRRDAVAINFAALLSPRRSPGLFRLDPLREWLRRKLPVTRFEDLSVPLVIATTDLQEAKAAYWQGKGDIIEPLVASMSLPGLFPPVEIGGHQFVDGGIANNLPLEQAVRFGARHLYAVSCACCPAGRRRYRGFYEVLARSFSIAIDCRQDTEVAEAARSARVHFVRPALERDVGLLDFRYTADLIDAGYREALKYFHGPVEAGQFSPAPGTSGWRRAAERGIVLARPLDGAARPA